MDRPQLHVRPERGWLNDPNGPTRWGERYHLFFQHNPLGPLHGSICWGHVSSDDLVGWRAEPVALRPTEGGADAAGCWSGCVVDDGGVPTAVYTALATADPMSATICLAVGDDELRSWRAEPVPVAEPPAAYDLVGFRDPFVFWLAGHRYAVVGAGRSDGTSVLLVYGCDALREWTLLGPLLDSRPAVRVGPPEVWAAEIWECPQLFRVRDRWVLVLSLVAADSLTRVAYLVGDLETTRDGLRFRPGAGDLLDHGHDFYAPAVLVEPDRALAWGWSWEDRAQSEVDAAGWAGVLTWPRELDLGPGGRLVARPAGELDTLRGAAPLLTAAPGVVPVPEGPVAIDVEVTLRPATLRLDAPGAALSLTIDAGQVRLDREVHEESRRAWRTTAALAGGTTTVRLVVDGSVVEVYVDGGPTYTERVYPSGSWSLEVPPGATATVHPLALPPS